MILCLPLILLVSTQAVETSSRSEPKWALGAGIQFDDFNAVGTLERRLGDSFWLRMGLNASLVHTTSEPNASPKSIGALLGVRYAIPLVSGLTISPVGDFQASASEVHATSVIQQTGGISTRRQSSWSIGTMFGFMLEKSLVQGLSLRGHTQLLTLGVERSTSAGGLARAGAFRGLSSYGSYSSEPSTHLVAALGLGTSISLLWIF